MVDPGAAPAAPDPPPWRRDLEALHGDGLRIGVSPLRRAGWSLKLVAADPLRLRDALKAVRTALAAYFPRLLCDTRKL